MLLWNGYLLNYLAELFLLSWRQQRHYRVGFISTLLYVSWLFILLLMTLYVSFVANGLPYAILAHDHVSLKTLKINKENMKGKSKQMSIHTGSADHGCCWWQNHWTLIAGMMNCTRGVPRTIFLSIGQPHGLTFIDHVNKHTGSCSPLCFYWGKSIYIYVFHNKMRQFCLYKLSSFRHLNGCIYIFFVHNMLLLINSAWKWDMR